jgi:four helix bundle protein
MPRRQFDHEKLEVYQFELRFIEWATDLLTKLCETPLPRLREVCDQPDRSSLSPLLNTAEGNGRRGLKQRVKFFDDARGSATEGAACLNAIVAKRACGKERIEAGKEMLLSIVSVLTKLVEKFEGVSGSEEEGGGRAGVGLVRGRTSARRW